MTMQERLRDEAGNGREPSPTFQRNVANHLDQLEADNARLLTQWQAMKDETLLNQQATAKARADKAELVAWVELATNEFNAVRARDGAPQHIDWYHGQPLQTDSCTHEWWSEMTENGFALIAKHRNES